MHAGELLIQKFDNAFAQKDLNAISARYHIEATLRLRVN